MDLPGSDWGDFSCRRAVDSSSFTSVLCVVIWNIKTSMIENVSWWSITLTFIPEMRRVLSVPWWRHQMVTFPRYWPFVRGIHRSPVNSPHKGQWRGALMFSLISVWINRWVNNREAGDLRRYRAHYHAAVMQMSFLYVAVTSHVFQTLHSWIKCMCWVSLCTNL